MDASIRTKAGWITAGLWGAYTTDLIIGLSTEGRRGLPPELSLLALVGACASTLGWLAGRYTDDLSGQVDVLGGQVEGAMLRCQASGLELGIAHNLSYIAGGAEGTPAERHPGLRARRTS